MGVSAADWERFDKGAFTEVEVPSCYNRNGSHYYTSLPDFVKTEDVIRSKRAPSTPAPEGTKS